MNIDERVRVALLAGSDGAPQLTEAQLQQIDAIYKLVTPSREEELPIQVSRRCSLGCRQYSGRLRVFPGADVILFGNREWLKRLS